MIIPLAAFGNLMGFDGIIILIVLLLLFGAKKLPELARGIGQSLNEFKKARDDFEHEIRAGQQDGQAREAANRQPHVAAVPTQSLPYKAPTETVATQPDTSAVALQQQVEQLQQQLREMREQKETPTQEAQPPRVG